jgi:hypothetical protein
MLFLFMALLTACSTASDYQKPITAFSQATDGAKQALAALDERLAEQLQALRRAEAVASPNRVRFPDDECATSTAGCTLLLYPESGDAKPRPLTYTTAVPNQIQVMHEVSLYAKGLQDITTADATPGIKAGFDSAMAAATSLASILQPQFAPAVSALSVPVTQAAVWLFGEYQESVKLRALRAATAAMDPILQEAVRVFAKTSEFAALEDQQILVGQFDSRMEAFENAPSEQALAQLADAATQLDRLLAVRPDQMFEELGLAHQALTEALASDEITFAQALLHIERLATKAEELTQIAESFKAAVASQ